MTEVLRKTFGYRIATTVAILALAGALVLAQEADEEPAEIGDDNQQVEANKELVEIVVVAPRPGDRQRVDQEYEDPARAKLLKDFYEMKELDEEYAWRTADGQDSSSRIKWGYDPRDDYRMRNEMDLQELSWEKTKPATLFRVEF